MKSPVNIPLILLSLLSVGLSFHSSGRFRLLKNIRETQTVKKLLAFGGFLILKQPSSQQKSKNLMKLNHSCSSSCLRSQPSFPHTSHCSRHCYLLVIAGASHLLQHNRLGIGNQSIWLLYIQVAFTRIILPLINAGVTLEMGYLE